MLPLNEGRDASGGPVGIRLRKKLKEWAFSGEAALFSDLDLHQLAFVDSKLDRTEPKPVQRFPDQLKRVAIAGLRSLVGSVAGRFRHAAFSPGHGRLNGRRESKRE